MQRSYTPEIMDDFSINDERIDKALSELKYINTFLGGNSTSIAGFNEVLKFIPANVKLKILDAGSGASDIFLSLRNLNEKSEIFSMDINPRACRFIRANSQEFSIICGDILKFPIKNDSCDIAHASLFLHHFSEEKIKQILKSLINSSKYAVIINDLRRSILAYWGIKILTLFFSNSNMVKNDAPLSVKRAFVKNDLLKIFKSLDIKHYKVKRKWAFRWLIIIYKN